jgi:hypothetical protein
MNIVYGKVTTHETYKNGNVSVRKQRVEESIPLNNKQELLDNIFNQLLKLKTDDSVEFKVYADKRTHEPYRIVVVSESEV